MSDPDRQTEPAAKPDDAPSLVGTTIAGRYRVDSLLGEGGMGAVYQVQHLGIRKRMALKLLRPDLVSMPSALTRFEREAMASAHFEHPNVAAAVDFGRTEEGRCYLVLEYVEGRELRKEIERAGGPLPAARALFLVRQIVSALVRAGELGIVHRDLKPENVMLVRKDGHDDFVKILDFGLAHLARPIVEEEAGTESSAKKLTQTGEIFGTPAYMAPEQAFGGAADARTDLYAAGVILYELLTGVRPFVGRSPLILIQQVLSTPAPAMKERAPGVTVLPELEALVLRLLAKKPEERVQTPQELLAAIDRIVTEHGLVWPPDGAVQQAASSGRSLPVPVSPSAPELDRFAAVRARLPLPLRRHLGPVVIGVLLLLIGSAALIRSLRGRPPGPVHPDENVSAGSKRGPVPTPPADAATQAELDAARTQGPDALRALAEKHPSDPRIHHALVRSLGSQRRYVEAMQALARLGSLDPEAGRDVELIKLVVAAVQDTPESLRAAAALIEKDLGEAGIDLLYDLTVKQTQARWKPVLNQSAAKPEVLARASAATRVALELRAARTCEAKRALLSRAKEEGAQRALAQLRPLTQQQGCSIFGLGDCWPCLRRDNALQEAIAAIEARSKSAPARAAAESPGIGGNAP